MYSCTAWHENFEQCKSRQTHAPLGLVWSATGLPQVCPLGSRQVSIPTSPDYSIADAGDHALLICVQMCSFILLQGVATVSGWQKPCLPCSCKVPMKTSHVLTWQLLGRHGVLPLTSCGWPVLSHTVPQCSYYIPLTPSPGDDGVGCNDQRHGRDGNEHVQPEPAW